MSQNSVKQEIINICKTNGYDAGITQKDSLRAAKKKFITYLDKKAGFFQVAMFDIIEKNELSEGFLLAFSNNFGAMVWSKIFSKQRLNTDFIEIALSIIKNNKEISESYVNKLIECACLKQKLTEEFIDGYSDRVNWSYISRHQILSKEFIVRHKDKIDWMELFRGPNSGIIGI